ncbi:MAG: sigma-70 family RNA polymerase sigma factor [Planctomycetaceae bacterium]
MIATRDINERSADRAERRAGEQDIAPCYPVIVTGLSIAQRRQAMDDLRDLLPGCQYNDEFAAPKAAQRILNLPDDLPRAERKQRVTGGLDLARYFGETAKLPLLTAEEETFYFRRMNFLRWRAEQTFSTLNESRPSIRALRKIVEDLQEADRDRNFIAEHNLRLVIPLAHRLYLRSESVWDYISEGNAALLRAVRGFDYGRGFRFSTYATWAIVNSMQRLAGRQHRDATRFMPTEFTVFDGFEGSLESQTSQEQRTTAARAKVAELLNVLDERSQRVVAMRFGIEPHSEPRTLKEVGDHFGISKERIRQIEKSALGKMGLAADSTLPV